MAEHEGWRVMRSRIRNRWIAESPEGHVYGFPTEQAMWDRIHHCENVTRSQTELPTIPAQGGQELSLTAPRGKSLTVGELAAFLQEAIRQGASKDSPVKIVAAAQYPLLKSVSITGISAGQPAWITKETA